MKQITIVNKDDTTNETKGLTINLILEAKEKMELLTAKNLVIGVDFSVSSSDGVVVEYMAPRFSDKALQNYFLNE